MNNGIRTIGASSHNRRGNWSGNFRYTRNQGNLFWFFIKPKLLIDAIREEEEPIETGAIRKHLKIVIRNTGKSVAEDCQATATLISERSTAKIKPTIYERDLVWENKERSIRIHAHGKKVLYFVFSQVSFQQVQSELRAGIIAPEDEKVYAKIVTPNSFNYTAIAPIAFQEDALRIGDTYLHLHVETEDGYHDDAVYCVTVTSDFHGLSMRRVC